MSTYSESLSRLDALDERKNENLNNIKQDIKRIERENKENKFKKEQFESIKDDPIVRKIFGEYKDVMSNTKDRTLAFGRVIEELHQMTEKGLISENHPLRVAKTWKPKLLNWSKKIFDFQDEKLGLGNFLSETHQSDDTQLLFNKSFFNKTGKENDNHSLETYRNIIQKVNIIEAIMAGEWRNYSSNIYTKNEIEQINAGKNRGNVAITHKNKNEDLQYKQDDYNKVYDNVYTRFEKCKSTDDLVKKVPDVDVAAIICGEFGIRRATVHLLTTEDIDVGKGVINVPAFKNVKSHVAYTAETDNDLVKELLRQIVRRAAIKNIDAINSDGEIPLISCSKTNLYKEFKRLEKKSGVTTNYHSKTFHALRRLYGQRMYDIYRTESESNNPKKSVEEWKNEALAKVNILLGHNESEIKNVYNYVRNVW